MKRSIFLTISLGITSALLFFLVSFAFYSSNTRIESDNVSKESGNNESNVVLNQVENSLNNLFIKETKGDTASDNSEIFNNTDNEDQIMIEHRITPETKIIYEYYDNEENYTVAEEKPPYFIIDMTKEKLAEALADWQIVSFSSDKVIVRKNIKGKNSSNYIIGISDGFVAVFCNNYNGISLKEVTEKPVSSLSPEEQEKLSRGIYIEGDEKLHKLLEDYSS